MGFRPTFINKGLVFWLDAVIDKVHGCPLALPRNIFADISSRPDSCTRAGEVYNLIRNSSVYLIFVHYNRGQFSRGVVVNCLVRRRRGIESPQVNHIFTYYVISRLKLNVYLKFTASSNRLTGFRFLSHFSWLWAFPRVKQAKPLWCKCKDAMVFLKENDFYLFACAAACTHVLVQAFLIFRQSFPSAKPKSCYEVSWYIENVALKYTVKKV